MDKLLGRKQRPESKPPDCLARYNCIKHSWRGRLRRVFCITPTAVHTQNPDKTLVLTNSYTFVDDSDLESVSIGSDEFEFTISVRQDKRVSFLAFHACSCC
jgi:DnaJ family protein C protein 13